MQLNFVLNLEHWHFRPRGSLVGLMPLLNYIVRVRWMSRPFNPYSKVKIPEYVSGYFIRIPACENMLLPIMRTMVLITWQDWNVFRIYSHLSLQWFTITSMPNLLISICNRDTGCIKKRNGHYWKFCHLFQSYIICRSDAIHPRSQEISTWRHFLNWWPVKRGEPAHPKIDLWK